MRQSVCALVVVFLVMFTSPVAAQNVTMTSKAAPVYLGANGAIFYDGAVLQSDAVISWDSGFFAGVWISSAGNTAHDFDKEIDLFAGYGGKVWGLGYSASVMYLVIQGIDVVQVAGEVSSGPLFVRVEGYSPTQSGGPGRGILAYGGLRTSGDLSKRVKLYMEGWVKNDSGAFGFERTLLAQGYHGLGITITDATALRIGGRWSAPLFRVNDGRKTELAWEIGLSRSFGR